MVMSAGGEAPVDLAVEDPSLAIELKCGDPVPSKNVIK
jgi:hypothetical protein